MKAPSLLCLGVILLGLATALFADTRFLPIGRDLLRNGDILSSLEGWERRENGSITFDPAGAVTLAQTAREQGSLILRQDIAVPSGARFIRVRADYQKSGVVHGKKPCTKRG